MSPILTLEEETENKIMCYRCQQKGHKSLYCKNEPNCMKCGSSHETKLYETNVFIPENIECLRCKKQGINVWECNCTVHNTGAKKKSNSRKECSCDSARNKETRQQQKSQQGKQQQLQTGTGENPASGEKDADNRQKENKVRGHA
ncbi:hypothetical protein SK128_003790, partial [Halocaridina rubra]